MASSAVRTKTSIFIRNALGDVEVKKNNIKSQRSTGLSLMPNGFEALGPEPLRDLLTTFVRGNAFRVLDISSAATVNGARDLQHPGQACRNRCTSKNTDW